MFASVAASICAMGAQAESSRRVNEEKKKPSRNGKFKMDAAVKKELLDTLNERIEDAKRMQETNPDERQSLQDIERNFRIMKEMIQNVDEE